MENLKQIYKYQHSFPGPQDIRTDAVYELMITLRLIQFGNWTPCLLLNICLHQLIDTSLRRLQVCSGWGEGGIQTLSPICVCVYKHLCVHAHVSVPMCAHTHTWEREAFFLSHFSEREVRSCGGGSGEREMVSEPVSSEYWMVWGKWQLNERQSCSKAVNIPAAWFPQGKTVVDRLTKPYNTSESKLTLIAMDPRFPDPQKRRVSLAFSPSIFPCLCIPPSRFGVVSVQQTTLICALGRLPGAAGTEVNPSATWVEMTQPWGTALIKGQNRNIVGAELPDEALTQLRWREAVSWATGAVTLYPEGVWQHQGHHCPVWRHTFTPSVDRQLCRGNSRRSFVRDGDQPCTWVHRQKIIIWSFVLANE